MKVQRKRKRNKTTLYLWFVAVITVLILTGCGQQSAEQAKTDDADGRETVTHEIVVQGDGVKNGAGKGDEVKNAAAQGEWECDLEKLAREKDNYYAHVYSAINNWPTKKNYVAEGVILEALLKEAGVYDTFQTVTFQGEDGYQMTMTREQILCDRYYYPNLKTDSNEGAQPVKMILALKSAEDTDDVTAAEAVKTTLLFGQSNANEHNSPAFVESLSAIIVSSEPVGRWEMATTFPQEGAIAAGESVKLQHPEFGLVKLFYTLDGSDPTEESALYNPSTYQPELNIPLPINETTVLKVLVTGYGKENSAIATFRFTI